MTRGEPPAPAPGPDDPAPKRLKVPFMPTRQKHEDRQIIYVPQSADPTAASSSFNPAAAMPG
eukprot:16429042-Heterocapsa_arctica.AAC.1